MRLSQVSEQQRRPNKATQQGTERARENREAILGGGIADAWVFKGVRVAVWSGKMVCKMRLGCGDDVDDKMC